MAKRAIKSKTAKAKTGKPFRPLRWALRWAARIGFAGVLLAVAAIMLGLFFNPPTTPYMFSESRRLDGVAQQWVALEDIAPVMARSAVAAEDANFCNHWGFDLPAIRDAIEAGSTRGASTISQQTVKNVYLWHGRTYVRKVIEALMTPLLETLWSKRRIIEVYLNIAEFDQGVFGVGAAAPHYFGVSADQLTPVQAARLAAILPAPKTRSAGRPSAYVRKRAAQILDGAATIGGDGRAACFES